MSSIRRSFWGAFTGRDSAVPRRRLRQKSAAGHAPHRGGPLGAQTVAPSSMVAWLKRRMSGPLSGMTAWSWARMRRLVRWSRMSSWQSVRRVTTRRTLPSTAASRRPKQAEAMALAV